MRSNIVPLIALSTGLILLSAPAIAAEQFVSYFEFNEFIGHLWVEDVTVTFDPDTEWYPPRNCGGNQSCTQSLGELQRGTTYAYVDLVPAACPTDYHIRHEVTLTYRDGSYWFRRYRVVEGSGEEGRWQTLVFAANGYYGNPGTVDEIEISATSDCVYHGVFKAPWDWF